MSPDHPRRRRRAPRALAWSAAAAAATLCCGCITAAEPSPTPPPPPAQPVSVKQAAQSIQAIGPKGELSDKATAHTVAQLSSEGRGQALQRHLAVLGRNTGSAVYVGNRTELLVDGPATFASMFQALEGARRSILLESYIIEDSSIAQRLGALLQRKRAEGVGVAVLYDAVGSIGTDKAYFEGLQKAGIATCAFNPLNPTKRPGYWSITHRDHRKILAVDGQVAYTGGINISNVYSSGSFGSGGRAAAARPAASATADGKPAVNPDEGWRDTQVRIEGTAAAALDTLVRSNWRSQGCKGGLPPELSPPTRKSGDDAVAILPASPTLPSNPVYSMLLSAVGAAKESVYITMAYFAPGEEMVQALADAAKRGVEVRLILPSVSDFKPVLAAGQAHYDRLLSAGVHIHELQTAVLHAKTAVIDGVVSTVGSSNMDWRSMAGNDEVNAVVFGADFGQQMTALFRRDLTASRALSLAQWRDRPFIDRAWQGLASWFERLW